MKRLPIVLIIFLLFLLLPHSGWCQTGPGDGGCDPFNPACPIDGGLGFLLVAGIGLGAKKAYQARKAKEDQLSA